MSSSPPTFTKSQPQILPIEEETHFSTPILFRPVVRRTPSYSWSSSPSHSCNSSFRSSSYSLNEECSPFTPSTPLKFKGIPFSWERIPGIPKQQGCKKKESSKHLLPLPPAGNSNSAKKLQIQEEISPKKNHQNSNRFQRDPFIAALEECSKDKDYDHGTNFGSSKIARTLSDRFGFINMYNSCKRTCAVSESMVYLPTRRRPHYLLNPRSS
ncbi:hypothetical protein ACJIZ3_019095 [Penstemon smallii]|uniref:Uncharacterized protein n=1 Tax=Penstemon smallii TaxID=265156 RepID=A0ABD3T1G2_9LAMI